MTSYLLDSWFPTLFAKYAVKFRDMVYTLFLEILYSVVSLGLSKQRATIVARCLEKSSSRMSVLQ